MAYISREERNNAEDKGQALPGGRFPIRNGTDLHNAIRAVGRAKGSHDAVRRFIIKRAKALGMSDAIPSNWREDGSIA